MGDLPMTVSRLSVLTPTLMATRAPQATQPSPNQDTDERAALCVESRLDSESSPQKSTVAIVTILHVATPWSFSIIQMKGEPAMMRFHDR